MRDPGTHGLHILRVLSAGPLTLSELNAQLSSVAAPQVAAILARMVKYGYVSDSFSRYRITSKGLAQLPRTVSAPTMRPYVPERVIRRAGSDVAGRLPSVFAGERIYPGEST